MREIVTINTEVEISDIRPLICELRGQVVMLDRDLASLYHVMTGRLNEAVKRNIARFPAEFMFQLSDLEMKELIANCDRFRMMKHSPSHMYAFTEQGVESATTASSSLTARRFSGLVPLSKTPAASLSQRQKWARKSFLAFSPQSARQHQSPANTAPGNRKSRGNPGNSDK